MILYGLFQVEHRKEYKSEIEEKFRMKIFMDNKNKVEKHNRRFHKGEVSFTLKLNHFADMVCSIFIAL